MTSKDELKKQKKQHRKYQPLSSEISLMELQQTYHRQEHFAELPAILVKTETYQLHQLTEKTFLICHRCIVPQQIEIPFWCMIAVQEMNKELFSYHRTHCSFWHIPSSGMLMVCSRSPEIFFQLHTLHGQCDIIIFPCFHFCQIKMKTLTIGYLNSLFQLVNNLGNGPNDVLVDFKRSTINAF